MRVGLYKNRNLLTIHSHQFQSDAFVSAAAQHRARLQIKRAPCSATEKALLPETKLSAPPFYQLALAHAESFCQLTITHFAFVNSAGKHIEELRG